MTLVETMPYIWASVIVFAVFLEAATAGLVAVWFMPGAILALLLSLTGALVWLQSLLFFITSVLLLVFYNTIIKKFARKRPITPTNADAVIGKRALVIEKIDNIQESGLVRVNSQIWTARSSDPDRIYPEGELVKVIALEGVKLICE